MTKNGYNRPLPATPNKKKDNGNINNNIKINKNRSSSTALHRSITPMKTKEMRGNNTIQRNAIKRSKTDKDNHKYNESQTKSKIELEKSKSISNEDDETFLATISSEEDKVNTPKRTISKYYVTPKWKKNSNNKSKHKSLISYVLTNLIVLFPNTTSRPKL